MPAHALTQLMTDAAKTNLLDLDRTGLVDFFTSRGEKSFRAAQVMKWIYGQGVTDFEAMSNISKGVNCYVLSSLYPGVIRLFYVKLFSYFCLCKTCFFSHFTN